MQTGAVVGVADVHAGTLAHGIQALQNLDGFSPISLGTIGLSGGLCAHAPDVLLGGIFATAKRTPKRAREHAKFGLGDAKNCIILPWLIGPSLVSASGRDTALLDAMKLSPIGKRREGLRVGA